MSRVALNGRFSYALQPTGTQTVAYHLFDAIIRSSRDFEIVVFADPAFPGISEWGSVPKTKLIPVPFHEWSRSRAQLWEQLVLPWRCRREGCEIAHHPINTSPAFSPGVKSLVTLHDLNFLLHPEWYTRSFCLAYQMCALPGFQRADRVVAISDYVKDQAGVTLKIPATRLGRIYNGVKVLEAAPAAPGRARYIICVGSLQPHKNLPRTLRAFRSLRKIYPDLELRIVGRRQTRFVQDPELAELLETPGLEFLGYISDQELAQAYSDAALFCYPSLEEGFGLPVLEAMSLGTPVITSNVSCLPEISGGCAELVDPLSEPAIEAAMRKILDWSDAERSAVVQKGRAWAQKFTWEVAAEAYIDVYRAFLAKGARRS